MARPLRIEYEGAFYHVLARGQRKDNIFFSDDDRHMFLLKLEETCIKYAVYIHSYCLMNNHYHLLMETPLGNLSQVMHFFNASYSNYVKAKNNLVGSVFQGRYKSILIDTENYLMTLSAYIHLNPVRANLCELPQAYEWSSLQYYVGKNNPYKWLKTSEIMKSYTPKDYLKFITSWYTRNKDIDKHEIYGSNGVLGDEKFMAKVRNRLELFTPGTTTQKEQPEYRNLTQITTEEIVAALALITRKSQEEILQKERGNRLRLLALYATKKFTEASLIELGELFDISYNSVDPLIKVFDNYLKFDKYLMSIKKKLDLMITNSYKT